MEKGFILTFSGSAGSGKDTFVKMFIQDIKKYASIYAPRYLEKVMTYMVENGVNFDPTIMSFALADTMKGIFARNFGYTEENKNDFRSDLQYFGTEIGRSYDENVWIWNINSNICMMLEQTPCRLFVITDARFKNELEIDIDELKTLNVLVVGEDHRNEMTECQKSHASEQMSQDNSIQYNYTITNTGTLEELESLAKDFAIVWLKKINELSVN